MESSRIIDELSCYRGQRLGVSSERAAGEQTGEIGLRGQAHVPAPATWNLMAISESIAVPADELLSTGETRSRESLVQAHMELGKVRLSAMVVFTTALGFVVGSRTLFPEQFDWWKLLWTCLGTFLAAVGAASFNQAIEARRDARMHRTRNRPLPAGILSRTYAATFGLIVCIIGVAILCPTSNGLTAVLATANILVYALLYTPMKPYSTVNTLVGAVVGGIPPMLGWTAATGTIGAGAWVLGGILFVWQVPHFLALSWMYREDYARGGFKMLPVTDATGRLTATLAMMYGILLAPLCLMLVLLGNAGLPFAVISILLTAGLVAVAGKFAKSRTNGDARKLFFASIIYLPVLTVVLMADARGPMDGLMRTSAGYVTPSSEKFVDPGATSLPPATDAPNR
jgi:protoheme IX farnesyltransferase